mmetsp:Transcript_14675/g.40542  ORF Transcript_14675/g.40542 Transcript_14675/m.40542 type:complete len:81 (-) Transcript_14675:450-692(-)
MMVTMRTLTLLLALCSAAAFSPSLPNGKTTVARNGAASQLGMSSFFNNGGNSNAATAANSICPLLPPVTDPSTIFEVAMG